MNFGKEWKDDNWATKLNSLILLLATLGAATIWITMPAEQTTAMIYILMGLFVAILGGLDTGRESHPTVGAVGLGNQKKAITGFIIGVVLALLFFGVPFSITPELAVAGSQLYLVYIVLFSPILEEMLFRGALLFTLAKQMPGWLAVITQAGVFASWHWIAYSGDQNSLWMAFAFGVIAAILNQITQTLATSLGFHIVYNYMVVAS